MQLQKLYLKQFRYKLGDRVSNTMYTILNCFRWEWGKKKILR